jgi:alkanesulfonate monooxygenase SsuD/methylene tetrahydromethanopterin reductase-like flavin-dependent oxidoreductase (luciferase family)
MTWGDPDEVGEQVQALVATGLDGVVFNMPADGHDVEAVQLAGETLNGIRR